MFDNEICLQKLVALPFVVRVLKYMLALKISTVSLSESGTTLLA
jgi:hypothetical protein